MPSQYAIIWPMVEIGDTVPKDAVIYATESIEGLVIEGCGIQITNLYEVSDHEYEFKICSHLSRSDIKSLLLHKNGHSVVRRNTVLPYIIIYYCVFDNQICTFVVNKLTNTTYSDISLKEIVCDAFPNDNLEVVEYLRPDVRTFPNYKQPDFGIKEKQCLIKL